MISALIKKCINQKINSIKILYKNIEKYDKTFIYNTEFVIYKANDFYKKKYVYFDLTNFVKDKNIYYKTKLIESYEKNNENDDYSKEIFNYKWVNILDGEKFIENLMYYMYIFYIFESKPNESEIKINIKKLIENYHPYFDDLFDFILPFEKKFTFIYSNKLNITSSSKLFHLLGYSNYIKNRQYFLNNNKNFNDDFYLTFLSEDNYHNPFKFIINKNIYIQNIIDESKKNTNSFYDFLIVLINNFNPIFITINLFINEFNKIINNKFNSNEIKENNDKLKLFFSDIINFYIDMMKIIKNFEKKNELIKKINFIYNELFLNYLSEIKNIDLIKCLIKETSEKKNKSLFIIIYNQLFDNEKIELNIYSELTNKYKKIYEDNKLKYNNNFKNDISLNEPKNIYKVIINEKNYILNRKKKFNGYYNEYNFCFDGHINKIKLKIDKINKLIINNKKIDMCVVKNNKINIFIKIMKNIEYMLEIINIEKNFNIEKIFPQYLIIRNQAIYNSIKFRDNASKLFSLKHIICVNSLSEEKFLIKNVLNYKVIDNPFIPYPDFNQNENINEFSEKNIDNYKLTLSEKTIDEIIKFNELCYSILDIKNFMYRFMENSFKLKNNYEDNNDSYLIIEICRTLELLIYCKIKLNLI